MAGYIGNKSSVTLVDGYTEAEADAEFVAITGDTMSGGLTVQGAFTSQGIDDNGNAVALTIDSSENVLVGQTSFNTGNVGGGISNYGFNYGTVDGGLSARFTRLTSDGDIMQFRKDGTTVGNIGSNGTASWIACPAGSGAGLRFDGSDNRIVPTEGDGTNRNAAVDLGYSSSRFKDLYLSGGAYIGGAVAANKFDDYEEGTFTPAIAGVSGTFAGDYTKIGDLVTFCITCTGMSGTASASLVTGLPFTAANTNRNYAVAFGNTNLLNTAGQSGQTYFTGFVVPNSTTVQIDTGRLGVANNRSNLAVANSNIILEFSGSYKA